LKLVSHKVLQIAPGDHLMITLLSSAVNNLIKLRNSVDYFLSTSGKQNDTIFIIGTLKANAKYNKVSNSKTTTCRI